MPSDVEQTTTRADAPALLSIRDLEVCFSDRTGAHPVLHGINVTVGEGERVAIVGESGSGKSTIAAAVIGLLPGSGKVTRWTIEFRGEDVTHADEKRFRRLRGRQVGLVPQDPMSNLNPVTRVGQQIAETLVAHGLASRSEAKRRAVDLMGEAGIPEAAGRARQYPHEFSGGMRQRVLIAIALDVTVQRQILDHLETLRAARGTSLLLVTHDLGLAADRADRVVVMSEGRVVESGPAEQILRDPQDAYTQRLVASAPSVATSRAFFETGSSPTATAVKEPEAPNAKSTEAQESPILVVQDLVKVFKIRGRRGEPLTAVDHVSFSTAAGTTTAIVGESGSGKTTVARMVLGLETPTSGEVRIGDDVVETARGTRRRAIRRMMQPVFQDPYASLNPTFTIEHIVDEPLRVFKVGDRRTRQRRVAALLDQVTLPRTIAQRYPNELSGGQRQRVAIARALALDPRLMVCDEAVSALDVLVQDQILRLLADLQRDLGLSFLFITHDLAVVRLIAHEVVVMREGRVVEAGDVTSVFDNPQSGYTKDLLEAIPGAEFFR